MATFKNIEEIKQDIIRKSESAIRVMQEKVYSIIDRFVKEYYAEYTPGDAHKQLEKYNASLGKFTFASSYTYERTYQLYQSLVKSRVTRSGNGFKAEVYFDADRLDYYFKLVNGEQVHNKGWSEEKTLESAAHGYHGGQIAGTAIWDEPIAILDQQANEMLKKELIKAGIPLK